MMEERRESTGGRRRTDLRILLRPIMGLLLLIVLLQVVLLILHSRSGTPLRQPSPAVPPRSEPEVAADALLKLELVSAEPELRQLVGQLKQALRTEARQDSFVVIVEDVRIESATGIGEVVVSARLRNNAPLALDGLLSRLQLRSAAGTLLYEATGEWSGAATEIWPPGESRRVRFLVDNPPQKITQATVILERLDFAVSGY